VVAGLDKTRVMSVWRKQGQVVGQNGDSGARSGKEGGQVVVGLDKTRVVGVGVVKTAACSDRT